MSQNRQVGDGAMSPRAVCRLHVSEGKTRLKIFEIEMDMPKMSISKMESAKVSQVRTCRPGHAGRILWFDRGSSQRGTRCFDLNLPFGIWVCPKEGGGRNRNQTKIQIFVVAILVKRTRAPQTLTVFGHAPLTSTSRLDCIPSAVRPAK